MKKLLKRLLKHLLKQPLKNLSIALISGLLTVPLLVAGQVLESEPQEVSEPDQSDGNSDVNDVASGGSASDSDSNSGDGSEEESPSRFIPTEQISQDLGVSFPADI